MCSAPGPHAPPGPRPTRASRRALAAAGLCVGLSWCALPSVADAQEIRFERTNFQFLREQGRSDDQYPYYISQLDCVQDDPALDDTNTQRATLQFRPNITGAQPNSNINVQIWVSTSADCTTDTERQPNGRCKLVASEPWTQQNPTLRVRPRDVALAVSTSTTSGAADVRGQGALEDCDSTTNTDNQALVFYILLLQGGNLVGSSATWDGTNIDLVGPPAPTSVDVGVGDEKLIVEWDLDDADARNDTLGFRIFCSPEGSAAPAGSAGLGGASGLGGAGAVAECSSALVPGELPDLTLECGAGDGRTTRQGRASGLDNGATYAVAVAAQDRVGNLGVLSPVACGAPAPVTTFFEAYRRAGGQGGGGFCNLGAAPVPGAALALIAAGATLAARRRRARS